MRTDRLKYVADVRVSNVDKKTVAEDVPVRLCNYTDVYYNERITKDLDFMAATATPEQRRTFSLRPGDVLLTKDSETADDIGVSAVVAEEIPDVVCGYHLAMIRPKPGRAYGPYLRYVLAAAPTRQAMSMAATGVTRFGLRTDALADLAIPLPPLDEQRGIADYLDSETTRIDALVSAKERMLVLLLEQFDSEISRVVWAPSVRRVRLKFLTTPPTSGNRDHASFTPTDEGIPCLRGLNVRPARIDRDNLFRITPEDHARHGATRLRAGDIVIVRSGLAGSAAVIPEDLDNCNCVDLVIVRRSEKLVPRYLEYVINSREAREQVAQRSVGALLTHFNAVDAADLAVPVRTTEDQREVVASLDVMMRVHRRLAKSLERQLSLLREHRQALITAAVTGKIDAPVLA